MSSRLVIKDAARQIAGRVISALCGFLVIKLITPYLWPLQYGDYSTILKYFAIRSALADFWLYVIAVKKLWTIKNNDNNNLENKAKLSEQFGKFVGTRFVIMGVVYLTALLLAYFLPAYTSNPFLIRGLPIWMLFSASFMAAGILQLPLQIFWKMEQLSIGLIIARIVQIAILAGVILVIFPKEQSVQPSLLSFILIIISVLASGITQGIYVRTKSKKYLKFRINFDRWFIKNILKENRQYGISYYLSSFHTLIVLIFLSLFFPTSQGFKYTGIRAMALALIEILLIIPSALGNSLLHKVGNYSLIQKRKSFWNLLSIMFRIWGTVFINFFLFNTEIVQIIGSSTYLGTWLANPGSNTILPYLALVLWLSFGKQVFNYLFVATERHNLLLKINLIGVIIGLGIAFFMIPKFNIIGGIITQVTLEVLFITGAIFIAAKHNILPKRKRKNTLILWSILAAIIIWGRSMQNFIHQSWIHFFIALVTINWTILVLSLPIIKKIAHGLTSDELNN